jgi:ribosomal protein S18 acetylase RimI-like enzyme
MIAERNFPFERMYDFLLKNDCAFSVPLSKSLEKFSTNLENYAKKLSEKATVAWEEDHGIIKGMVIGYTNDMPDIITGGWGGGQKSYITQVATDSLYRRQGVCQRLLAEYIEFCRKKNIAMVWLTTEETNFPARSVYEKAGFSSAEKIDGLIKYEMFLR